MHTCVLDVYKILMFREFQFERPTLDNGPGSNFLGTNLDWFEANWILELDCTLVPNLILGSPNQELSF
jgi:hypothetical protein